MRLQENIFQMKEQDKTPEEQPSKVNIGNQPWKEFKATMVKMIHNLRKWMEAQTERIQETFNKELGALKNRDKQYNN